MIELPVLLAPSAAARGPATVEVAFKGSRRAYHVSDDPTLHPGEYVVVECERGEDLGRVRSVGGVAARKCASCADGAEAAPQLRVLRRALPSEIEQLALVRLDEDRIRRKARELADRHSLAMKVTEAEWQWDRGKLTIYFTADRRVDFRELVRELARTFRTRIELKQIGARDEAALLGGVGRCGRELCCATWLREIRPVSLQLAKDQNLSLNPSQISGVCGRLLCCLTYEHDQYLQARKRFPREGKIIRTAHGQERVVKIDIWRDTVLLQDEAGERRTLELTALRAESDAAARPADAAGPVQESAEPVVATLLATVIPDRPAEAEAQGEANRRRRRRGRRNETESDRGGAGTE